jgi:hypothetical protein
LETKKKKKKKKNIGGKKEKAMILHFFIALLLIFLLISPLTRSNEEEDTAEDHCDLVLQYIPGLGLGVYSGRLFEYDELVEAYQAIPFPIAVAVQTVLKFYFEGHNETHGSIGVGNSLIYNHAPSVEGYALKKWGNYMMKKDPETNKAEPDTSRKLLAYKNSFAVFPGEQIMSFYGDEYFQQFGLEEVHPRRSTNIKILRMTPEETQSGPYRIPGCSILNTIQDRLQWSNSIGGTGFPSQKMWDEAVNKDPPFTYRLLARRPLKAGTIIEVARFLLIDDGLFPYAEALQPYLWRTKEAIAERSNHMNTAIDMKEAYKTSSFHSMVVLGNGMLYTGTANTAEVNVKYDWWYLSSIGIHDEDEYLRPSNDAETTAVESKRCSDHGFVSFVALRDIAANEPLLIDLQHDSQGDWGGSRVVNEEFANRCFSKAKAERSFPDDDEDL